MTIGIYKITFEGTDKVYIGQSINIEKRIHNHLSEMRKGISSIKLQEAFNSCGEPTFMILEEVSLDLLDEVERKYIIKYDAVQHGFNTTPGGFNNFGANASGSKYTKETYEEILFYLVNTSLSTKDISEITETTDITVRHISDLSRHSWLQEACPEEYKKLLFLREQGNKRCAISQGIKYPKIKSPDGIVYEVTNVTAFAKEHGLSSGALCGVLNYKHNTHKGWCREDYIIEKYPTIISPTGELHSIPYRGIKPFAQKHNLCPSELGLLLKRKIDQHKNWKINET